MQEDHQDLDAIFGAPIYAYTRAQALEDGVLVDVTETAKEVGFRVSVAMTTAAWADTVEWTEADSKRQTSQDQSGRLWDVVWMAYLTVRRGGMESRKAFQLLRVPRGGRGVRPRLTTLHIHIGPGDNGEPVITIMQPHED